MKTGFYSTGVGLIAENDGEATLLAPIEAAINSQDSKFPACLSHNLEGGPENRTINGRLDIKGTQEVNGIIPKASLSGP